MSTSSHTTPTTGVFPDLSEAETIEALHHTLAPLDPSLYGTSNGWSVYPTSPRHLSTDTTKEAQREYSYVFFRQESAFLDGLNELIGTMEAKYEGFMKHFHEVPSGRRPGAAARAAFKLFQGRLLLYVEGMRRNLKLAMKKFTKLSYPVVVNRLMLNQHVLELIHGKIATVADDLGRIEVGQDNAEEAIIDVFEKATEEMKGSNFAEIVLNAYELPN